MDLVTVFIVAIALAIGLWWQEDLTLTGIAATSIGVAAAIGVALQADIQDVFSGLAMNYEGHLRHRRLGDGPFAGPQGTGFRTRQRSQLAQHFRDPGGRLPGQHSQSSVHVESGRQSQPAARREDAGRRYQPRCARAVRSRDGYVAGRSVQGRAQARSRAQAGAGSAPEVADRRCRRLLRPLLVLPRSDNPGTGEIHRSTGVAGRASAERLPTPVQQIEITQPPNMEFTLGIAEIHDGLSHASLFRNALDQAQRESLACALQGTWNFPAGGVLMKQGDARRRDVYCAGGRDQRHDRHRAGRAAGSRDQRHRRCGGRNVADDWARRARRP
jgi:hypothetical protein